MTTPATEGTLLASCVTQTLQLWRSAIEHDSAITLATLLRRFERLWWDSVPKRDVTTLQLRDAGRKQITRHVRSSRASER